MSILFAILGIQRKKITKQKEEIEEVEAERDTLEAIKNIQEQTNVIKDDLAKKKTIVTAEKEEAIHLVNDIPNEKEKELSEEIKKLAADQFSRLHSRRMPNDKN